MDVENINQSVKWNLTTNTDWLTFNDTLGILNGTPTNDDEGEFWVKLVLNDSFDSDSINLTITVIEINDDPLIETLDLETILEDHFYRVDYNASDIDSPIIDQSWWLNTDASSWLKLNSKSGVLFGTPENDDVGLYWVNVSVDDSEGGIGYSNFTLEVIGVNDRPVITTMGNTTAFIDLIYYVDYNATDIDSDISNQQWSMETTTGGWLKINSDTGVLSGTPSEDDIGRYSVNVSVDDGDNGYAWHHFNLNVKKENTPPVITTLDNTTAIVNLTYQTEYLATDDSTPVDQLTWRFQSNASWLRFHSKTAILYGKPNEQNIGTYWVNISVKDLDAAFAFHNFTLIVKWPIISKPKEEINHPPVLSNPKMNPEKGDAKTEFIFTIHYQDSNDDPPVFIKIVIDYVHYNMILQNNGNASNGTYEHKQKLSTGIHVYYFTASDGSNIVTLDKFTTASISEIPKDSPRGYSFNPYIWILIIIFIVLMIAAVLIITRRKRKPIDKYQEERISVTTPDPQFDKSMIESSLHPTTSTTPTTSLFRF
jgi:hypothetical protein